MLRESLWFVPRLKSLTPDPVSTMASGTPSSVWAEALQSIPLGVCIFDEHDRLLFSNTRFLEIYGLAASQVAPGTSSLTVGQRIARARGTADRPSRELLGLFSNPNTDGEKIVTLEDGTLVEVVTQRVPSQRWLTVHRITNDPASDIRSAAADDTDLLTGLAGRATFERRLSEGLHHALRGHGLALYQINVDQFRCVNSCYGMAVGDGVLKEIAKRLRKLAAPSDSVVRIGGDEFAFIHTGVNEPSRVADLARTIIETLGKPYEIAGESILANVSIGISLAPGDALTVQDAERNADTAVGFARKSGGKTYRFFQTDMDAAMRSRQQLEGRLREALAKGNFEAVYQPIVDLRSGRVASIEALVRWRTSDGSIVRPGEFIALAEETGLIRPIGAWMLAEACRAATSWSNDIKVAVNFSTAQFRATRLSSDIAAALEESGLPASRLEIEITESLLLGDDVSIRRELNTLKDIGVSFSMDDFGTGYSSLATLSKFAFDKIKIDRGFVKSVADTPASLAILRSICRLANDLGATTVAEGVETRDQLEIVQREGCSQVQGYFFSPPVTSTNLAAAIHACSERARFHYPPTLF